MEAQGVPFPEPKKCDVYLVSMGEEAGLKAAALAEQLREEGLSAQFDTVGRGLKAQMKYADKIGAAYTVVLGDAELESRRVNLKNMRDGTQTELDLDDFVGAFQSIVLREALAALDTSDLDEADISTILGGVQN